MKQDLWIEGKTYFKLTLFSLKITSLSISLPHFPHRIPIYSFQILFLILSSILLCIHRPRREAVTRRVVPAWERKDTTMYQSVTALVGEFRCLSNCVHENSSFFLTNLAFIHLHCRSFLRVSLVFGILWSKSRAALSRVNRRSNHRGALSASLAAATMAECKVWKSALSSTVTIRYLSPVASQSGLTLLR